METNESVKIRAREYKILACTVIITAHTQALPNADTPLTQGRPFWLLLLVAGAGAVLLHLVVFWMRSGGFSIPSVKQESDIFRWYFRPFGERSN